MYEFNLYDLRRLGAFGNVTAKLSDNRIGKLKPDGLYITLKDVVINNQLSVVEQRLSYARVYSKIQTIKHGKKLIGERRDGKLVTTHKFDVNYKTKNHR